VIDAVVVQEGDEAAGLAAGGMGLLGAHGHSALCPVANARVHRQHAGAEVAEAERVEDLGCRAIAPQERILYGETTKS
jgi:hypothetical protein